MSFQAVLLFFILIDIGWIFVMLLRALWDFAKRYITVWHNVWSVRDQLQSPERSTDERAFLPAHLELTDTPVSVLPKWVARLIMLFAVLALLWSWFGRIDIVATAQGKTTLGGRSKIIQPLETAVVKSVLVQNGQYVKQGETLLTLSAIGSDSDVMQAEKALKAAQLAKIRHEILLNSVAKRQFPRFSGSLSNEWEPNILQEAQLLVQNQYQAWLTQDAQLASALQGNRAQLQSVLAQEKKLRSVGQIESQKTEDYRKLRQQDFISEHAYREQQSKSIANQNDLDSTLSQIQQIQQTIKQAESQRQLHTETLMRDTRDALRQANEQIEQYREQMKKAKQRQNLMILSSPVNGMVQELSAYTIGGVVTAAQKIMVVVPDDGRMEIEALVLNKDIGFVKEGQDAVIKIESFPYTRYGYLTGKVKYISHDAMTHEQLGLVYSASIVLDKNTLTIDGKKVYLSAGMNVSVEIKTGQRRVLDYLLSPLQTKVDESFKER